MKSVRIVQLDPATLHSLTAGERPLASPVPLTEHLTTGPEHRPLWRRRSRQVAADPAASAWERCWSCGPE